MIPRPNQAAVPLIAPTNSFLSTQTGWKPVPPLSDRPAQVSLHGAPRSRSQLCLVVSRPSLSTDAAHAAFWLLEILLTDVMAFLLVPDDATNPGCQPFVGRAGSQLLF